MIPCDVDGDWSAWSHDPDEVTELYLGLAMTKADRNDLVAKAKAVKLEDCEN